MRSYGGIGFSPRGSLTVSAIDEMRRREAASLMHVQPKAPTIDPSTLPARQQAALMSMRESHVSRAIVRWLLEDSQDGLNGSDFAPLRELALAERPDGYRLNRFTYAGREAARTLEQSLCLAFEIHKLTEGSTTGREVRFACPCGFSTMVRNSPTAYGNANSQHARWVATRQGMGKLVAALKPPGMAAEG